MVISVLRDLKILLIAPLTPSDMSVPPLLHLPADAYAHKMQLQILLDKQ